ncbi:hypothetical protein BJ912DRAFT_1038738 [Pholiota molesta]|nr:hypothetical protein BJ912DRAFT_1038738 [Pholiota molesta]
MPLNLNLKLNFASNSTSRPSPTTKRMRVAPGEIFTLDIAPEPLPHPAVLPPLDDDDSGRSRRSKSTEDRMNGQRETPARSSVYTRHGQCRRVLLNTRPIVPCRGMRRWLPGDINVTFLPLSYIRAYLAPASASPCTTVNPNVFAPSKSLRKAKATDDDIKDAAANDYDRALPLRHPYMSKLVVTACRQANERHEPACLHPSPIPLPLDACQLIGRRHAPVRRRSGRRYPCAGQWRSGLIQSKLLKGYGQAYCKSIQSRLE